MLLGDFEGENTGGGFAALEVTTKHTLPVNIAIASGGFGEPGPKSNEYHLTDENLLKSRYVYPAAPGCWTLHVSTGHPAIRLCDTGDAASYSNIALLQMRR